MNFVDKWCKKTGFTLYDIERDKLADLIEQTPQYRLAMTKAKDKTKRFYREVKMTLTGKVPSNYNNIFIGPPGKGKSYSELYLYVLEMETMGSKVDISKHFDFDKSRLQEKLNNVVMEYLGMSLEDFLKSGKLVRIKVVMNLDEDVQPAGTGSHIERQTLLDITKTVRQAMICFNYCTPIMQSKFVYNNIIHVFAINFDTNQTIGFLINPATDLPIGTVRFNRPPKNIEKIYEAEKNKYLLKAATGEFGGGRLHLRKKIAQEIINENYDHKKANDLIGIDSIYDAIEHRQTMNLIEFVASGRLSKEEQKIVFGIIISDHPELDRRRKKKKEVNE